MLIARTRRLGLAVLAGAAAALAVPSAASAQTVPDSQVVMLMREAELNCQGAAAVTQQEIVSKFMAHVVGMRVEVASAQISYLGDGMSLSEIEGLTTGTFSIKGCAPLGAPGGGRSRASSSDLGSSWAAASQTRANYVYTGAFSDYQDRKISYQFLVPNSQAASLRTGQKAKLVLRVARVDQNAIYGELVSLSQAATMMQCANGHQYAPSSGYRFCPVDGLPVK